MVQLKSPTYDDSNDGNMDFELPSEGVQLAQIYAVIDLGLQPGSQKYPAPKPKLLIMFELQEQLSNGEYAGQPFSVNMFVTNTSGTKGQLNTRICEPLGIDISKVQDIEKELVGKLCQVDIAHNYVQKKNRTYADINGSVQRPRRGDQGWQLFNGKTNPQWRYPKFAQRLRESALEPPEDIGDQWEPEEEGQGKAEPVMTQSQPKQQQPAQPQQQPQPEQKHPLDEALEENQDSGVDDQIPF